MSVIMNNGDASEAQGVSDTESAEVARRRLRGFAIHMAVFILITISLAGVNFYLAPGEWWFIFPMVLWGAPLAVHAAYAMGLFRVFR